MTDSLIHKVGTAEVGHTHADVSGGALRASVFGAMDGLVTNIALVAGVGAAGATPHFIVLTGLAGLVAGAFSMAMGEYTSVRTQNEQVDREWEKEAAEISENSEAEERELAMMFAEMGMSESTAALAARDVHSDPQQAALVHVTQELGLDPREKPPRRLPPSPLSSPSRSVRSCRCFPFRPASPRCWPVSRLGGLGLLIAGGLASLATTLPWWLSAVRQLGFGAVAAGATYLVGLARGVSVAA